MKPLHISFIIGFGLFSSQVNAQSKTTDSTFSTKRIDFNQEYTPEVKLPSKPKLTPSEPNIESVRQQSFSYEVPKQSLDYTYDAINIKPIALQPIPQAKGLQNYASLGFGNLSTVYADMGLTYHEEGKYDVHFHGHHFSQKGGLIKDRQSSNTDFRIGGKYFMKRYVLNGGIGFNRKGYTNYGYDHNLFQLEKNEILQAYNLFTINGSLDKFLVHERGINVQPSVDAYIFSMKKGGSESALNFNVPLSYVLNDGIEVGTGIKGSLNTSSVESKSTNNSFIQLDARATYSTGKLWANVGISPVYDSHNSWALLPNLQFRYAMGSNNQISLSAGWIGNVVQFNQKNLTTKNPFIVSPLTMNSIHKQAYAGIELALISNVKLEAKATYHTHSNYAYFMNDFKNSYGQNFIIEYAKNTSILDIYTGAHLLIANKFDLGAELNFYTFNETTSMTTIVHEPRMKAKAYMKVKPINNLTLGVSTMALAGIKYYNFQYEKVSLPTVFNLSVQGQYDFLKRYSVFLHLDNLTNAANQRWYQYDVYGFNIYGGIKVKF